MESCERHKMDREIWGNDYWPEPCVPCLREKVDVLWEVMTKDRKTKKSK